MKVFISVLVVASAVLLAAQDVKEDYDSFPPADYDSFYDYDQLKEEGEKIEAELNKLEAETDLKVKTEIDKFRENNKEYEDDAEESIDDYQFEDNRDKNEEPKEIAVEKDDAAENINAIDIEAKKKQDDQADYALLWGDDSVAPLPVPDVELPSDYKDILEETKKFLENDTDEFDEEIKKVIASAETADLKPEDDVIDDTKKILEETDDSFNADEEIDTDDINDAEQIKDVNDQSLTNVNDQLNNENVVKDEPNPVIIDDVPIEKGLESDVKAEQDEVKEDENQSNVVHDVIQEEDTVDKVYADLNSDLDKLLETLDKLSDDGVEGDEKLEEVFDKLDEHFFKEDDENVEGSEEVVDDAKDDNTQYSDVDFDKILEDIANEADFKEDDGDDIELNVELNDEMNEPNPDDAFENDVENLPKINTTPILYLDAIVEQNNAESVENTNDINKSVEIDASVEDSIQPKTAAATENKPESTKTVDIDTLNSDEVEDLVKQFSIAHSEVMDVNSETFDQNIAPIHIKLNVDSPEVVISPNYPSPYPTNNIVDWIFDGEGMGIELNITDFLVRGAMGDYLLVKPGGIDDSGHEGILFTYRLNSEKRFRFEDVDRMFVRFESTATGWNNMRGFQFSVKMIAPVPEEPEPIPEPEAVLDPPIYRHTLYLATPVRDFQELADDFQLIIADMAQEYIQDNNIDPGLNTTAEVTQITTIAPCPVTWPSYELCSAVTFGVSLQYEEEGDMLDEEALRDMWKTYSVRDPYALRLRRMDIAEFQPPSSTVLTAWLVIASGVLISMAMLAVVLWRFSCFEDYTRMKTYSDTDSLHNEKRGLDLYPTPHQTLPALYAENDLKWQDNEHEHDSTRVDMGGFANKNYARDMYDFESDEEVVTPRDRNGAVTSRDIYSGSLA